MAEVQEASVGKQARRIGLLVDGWPADFVQREARQHLGFREGFSSVLIRDCHNDSIRYLQTRIVGIR